MKRKLSSLFRRLRDVILTDARLYLIFEYLAMDLKKYLDCLGEHEEMDSLLIRVRIGSIANELHVLFSRVTCIRLSMLYSFVTVDESFIVI